MLVLVLVLVLAGKRHALHSLFAQSSSKEDSCFCLLLLLMMMMIMIVKGTPLQLLSHAVSWKVIVIVTTILAAGNSMFLAYKSVASQQDFENKWMYFGAADGVYSIFPGGFAGRYLQVRLSTVLQFSYTLPCLYCFLYRIRLRDNKESIH